MPPGTIQQTAITKLAYYFVETNYRRAARFITIDECSRVHRLL